MGVDDITPQLEVLEQIHGRAVFQPDFAHGSLSFVRSLVRSTQPQWWRTLIYMTISTMATAAPALLIEWVMTDFGAIQAAPLAIHNLLMLLCFPLVIYITTAAHPKCPAQRANLWLACNTPLKPQWAMQCAARKIGCQPWVKPIRCRLKTIVALGVKPRSLNNLSAYSYCYAKKS